MVIDACGGSTMQQKDSLLREVLNNLQIYRRYSKIRNPS
jgi:hypothetical protein